MGTKMLRLGATLVAFAVLAVGGSSIASAKAPPKPGPAAHQTKSAKAKAANRSTSSPKSAKEDSEPGDAANDTDAAAQAAACANAGVSGDNVNYDETTGTCTPG